MVTNVNKAGYAASAPSTGRGSAATAGIQPPSIEKSGSWHLKAVVAMDEIPFGISMDSSYSMEDGAMACHGIHYIP